MPMVPAANRRKYTLGASLHAVHLMAKDPDRHALTRARAASH